MQIVILAEKFLTLGATVGSIFFGMATAESRWEL